MTRTIVITGSTRGIGKAIAWKFAKHKWQVIINGSRENKNALRLINQIQKISSLSQLFIFNVADLNQTSKVCQAIIKKYHRIDVLVNNAGIREDALFINMTNSQWHNVISTNLYGVYNVTKNILPNMIKHKSGRIINISSVIGIIGGAGQTNYAASKAGLIAFSKSLAKEVAKYNISVNTICPGLVDTDFIKGVPNKYLYQMIDKTLVKRMADPDEVAELVFFLTSKASIYITGATFNIDGGWLS